MLTILHYLPYIIFTGLAVLALVALFSDDGRKKRLYPQRIRQQHYVWNDNHPRRD